MKSRQSVTTRILPADTLEIEIATAQGRIVVRLAETVPGIGTPVTIHASHGTKGPTRLMWRGTIDGALSSADDA